MMNHGGVKQMKKISLKNRKTILIEELLLLSIALIILFISSSVVAESTISIDASQQIADATDTINFTVQLIPDEPVKSFEFILNYDQSLLYINSVSPGDIFNGFSNFTSTGTIDNINGTITEIYSLILGPGNITTPGTLLRFNCTILTSSSNQTTWINLSNVGITNETCYLPIIIENTSILVNETITYDPYIENVSPTNQSTGVDKTLSELQINLLHPKGESMNYSVTTSPNIGSLSGAQSGNGTITIPVSSLSYETSYTWTITIEDDDTTIEQFFRFTTEDAPDTNNGGSSSGGGGFLPPSEPIEPVEDENHPPETPHPPQGPIYIEPGIQQSYQVSTWDSNQDTIRFRIDWGDGTQSSWSEYILSNETITVNHTFQMGNQYSITAISQDEQGLNSSWSDPIIVFVSAIDEIDNEDGVSKSYDVEVDDETGETQFSYVLSENISDQNSTVIWDFGDGTIKEGISPEHQYSSPGVYTVTVHIVDEQGQISTDTFTVTIDNVMESQDSALLEVENTQSSDGFPFILIIPGIIFLAAGLVVYFKW